MLREQFKSILNQNQSNVHLSLVVVVFFSQFYLQNNVGGSGLFMPYNIAIWLSVTCLIAFGIFRLAFQRKIITPAPIYSFLLLTGLIGPILSGAITGIDMPVEWWFRFLFIAGGFLFLFSLFQASFSTKQIELILLAIISLGLANGIFSFIQIHFADSLTYLFVSTHHLFPSGFFQQINTNASFLSTVVLICCYMASRPLFRKQNNNLLMCLIIVNVFFSTYIVFYSASRVGTLSLLVGLCFILVSRWRKFLKVKFFAIMILFSIAIGILSAANSESSVRLASKANSTFQHANARIGIYTTSIELIKKEPILGYGIGSFQKEFTEEAGRYLQKNPNSALADISALNHPHNEFLFWFIEGGLIAVFGMLAFCTAIMFAIVQLGIERGGAYTALLFPIVLHTQVELPFYLSSNHWFIFLFLCFMVINHKAVQMTFQPSLIFRRLLMFSSVLILFIGCLFLLNTLKANRGITQYWKQLDGELNLLLDASQNLYFSNYAERNIMALNGVANIHIGNEKEVKHFIDWAENYLTLYPDYVIRKILINAYDYLGEQTKACIKMQKSLFLYPKNKDLLALNSQLSCY